MRAFRLVCSFLLPALFGLGTLAPTVAVAQLTEQHTPGLRLLCIDGSEAFLVPHATRTALNSLRFQKKLFEFDPRGTSRSCWWTYLTKGTPARLRCRTISSRSRSRPSPTSSRPSRPTNA